MNGLAITLAIIALIKAFHFCYEMLWLLIKGSSFADEVENALRLKDEQSLNNLIDLNRRKTHKIIYFVTQHLGKAGTMVVNIAYRMPFLLFLISLLGYCVEDKMLTLLSIVVFLCTLAQAGYLSLSRIILGIADNYYHPVTYSSAYQDSRLAVSWNKRQVLHSFLIRFGVTFSSVVFSMGFVNYAVHRISSETAYHIGQTVSLPNILKFTYFSLVVITTTGFGDIYPISAYAMAITMIEILIGLTFLIVLLFTVSLTIDKASIE